MTYLIASSMSKAADESDNTHNENSFKAGYVVAQIYSFISAYKDVEAYNNNLMQNVSLNIFPIAEKNTLALGMQVNYMF